MLNNNIALLSSNKLFEASKTVETFGLGEVPPPSGLVGKHCYMFSSVFEPAEHWDFPLEAWVRCPPYDRAWICGLLISRAML
mmetsp:Transcript_5132/g.22160  ORF Transcript_5132/g.22160 Transcript_5132/m.22160 type:complete len:82 (-) Transcript_5132:465-710(-)